MTIRQIDLRARLADALRNHRSSSCGNWECGNWRWTYGFGWDDHLIDVLLSLDGIAIVELPPADSTRYEGDEHEPMDRLCWMPGDDFEVSVWGRGEIQHCGYGWGDLEPFSVAQARTIASALLAAADAAERGSE